MYTAAGNVRYLSTYKTSLCKWRRRIRLLGILVKLRADRMQGPAGRYDMRYNVRAHHAMFHSRLAVQRKLRSCVIIPPCWVSAASAASAASDAELWPGSSARLASGGASFCISPQHLEYVS